MQAGSTHYSGESSFLGVLYSGGSPLGPPPSTSREASSGSTCLVLAVNEKRQRRSCPIHLFPALCISLSLLFVLSVGNKVKMQVTQHSDGRVLPSRARGTLDPSSACQAGRTPAPGVSFESGKLSRPQSAGFK